MKYDVRPFCKKVLTHYETGGRHTLPWRKTIDPYRILVSEMMLQQTQVDRVIPYYKCFLKRFPSARALAKAPLHDVLKEWSGLGYNRRAKFLHMAAQAIVTHHGGRTPREYAALRALRGVGEYTAKAVRTFAFDEPESLLETNIRTALIHEFFPHGRKVRDEKLTEILEACLRHIESPRVWYWALMDYGAFIKREHGNASRRSKVYVKQTPFAGSLREVRGSILRTLAARGKADEGLLMKGGEFDLVRIASALGALAHEGMIRKEKEMWRIV